MRSGPASRRAAHSGSVAIASPLVELWDHGDPLDSARNDALVALAARSSTEIVATNNVHYHHPSRRRLASALAAVRARRSLDDMDGWLPAGGTAYQGRCTAPLSR